MSKLAGAALLLTALTRLSAQWIDYPTPGIPRTADGKPNLSAPVPKTAEGKPDLSGIWSTPDGKFNEETWLDDGGHPHTGALHVTERFRRRDFGHMDLLVTIDDPKAYTRPWSAKMGLDLQADTELIEFICENERDAVHMVGK